LNVTDALAAANRPAPAAAPAQRHVFVAGNVGELGEKLLNRLLSSSTYAQVSVASRAPLRSAHAKLTVHPFDPAHAAAAGLPDAVQDVVCCISGKAGFYKRDNAYVPVTTEQAASIAEAAQRAGAQRFLLVSPMSAWLQLSAAQAALFGELELALMQVELPATIVLRPSRNEEQSAAGSLLDRFAAGWLSVLKGYLTPPSLQQLRSDVIARAAVHFLQTAEPGFKVISGREIHAWAHPDAGPRRGF